MDREEISQNDSPSRKERRPGSRIGTSFTVTALLGSGGMGNVYRAKQDIIGREVAIKFLPAEIACDAVAIKRLQLEAQALGQLSHPGIVTTFDFGFTNEAEPYLVLEMVNGESLFAILQREKRMEMARAVPLFIQVAEAMGYAHSVGIVHRDIKPHNIMIGSREEKEFAKILDFGIVKMTAESQHLTRAGEIWGSPFYMSPEQCSGGVIDARTDIYCLGVVMYRALLGEVPHRGSNFAETVARKLSVVPPPFKAMAPDLDILPELEEIVMKCIQKDANLRYSTMQELRADLLKLYRGKLDSEATMTYGSINTVAKAEEKKLADTGSRKNPFTSNQENRNTGKNKKIESGSGNRSKLIPGVIAGLALMFCGVIGVGYYFYSQQELQPQDLKDPPRAVETPTEPPRTSTVDPTPEVQVNKPDTADNKEADTAADLNKETRSSEKNPETKTPKNKTPDNNAGADPVLNTVAPPNKYAPVINQDKPQIEQAKPVVKAHAKTVRKSPAKPVIKPDSLAASNVTAEKKSSRRTRLKEIARQAISSPRQAVQEAESVIRKFRRGNLEVDPNRFYRDFR